MIVFYSGQRFPFFFCLYNLTFILRLKENMQTADFLIKLYPDVAVSTLLFSHHVSNAV